MTLTIAEEVLLLAYRADTGTARVGTQELNAAIAGAILAELAVRHRIDVDGKRVAVTDPTPVGDDELDAVLARMRADARRRKPEWWTQKLCSSAPRKRLLARLTARGVLREQETRILGVIPVRRYPEADADAQREIRQRVESVLAGAAPDERVAALIAVLHATKLDRKVFPHASKERIKQIIQGEWAGEAVRKTINVIHAAGVAAAVAAASAAATATG